ncbi:MAG: hypothetical protein NT099_00205 [Candidatus Saganbacteria bacterium]|nr:hypothetical protein [Candidatus Saganbacteria bacterium]
MDEQDLWLKKQNVWVKKENGVIVEKKEYINSLQTLSMDNSRPTKRCFEHYINKYKYIHYQDVPCKKYKKYWSIPPGIIKKINTILVICVLNKSTQARKMSDYIFGYMCALEERCGIDVKCFGDVDKVVHPRNKSPNIRLIYLGNEPFYPKTGQRTAFEPIYCCPKCENKKDFILQWKGDCEHYVKCVKDKRGRYIEKKIRFDIHPVGRVLLLCQKCGYLIKNDPVVSKKGDGNHGQEERK